MSVPVRAMSEDGSEAQAETQVVEKKTRKKEPAKEAPQARGKKTVAPPRAPAGVVIGAQILYDVVWQKDDEEMYGEPLLVQPDTARFIASMQAQGAPGAAPPQPKAVLDISFAYHGVHTDMSVVELDAYMVPKTWMPMSLMMKFAKQWIQRKTVMQAKGSNYWLGQQAHSYWVRASYSANRSAPLILQDYKKSQNTPMGDYLAGWSMRGSSSSLQMECPTLQWGPCTILSLDNYHLTPQLCAHTEAFASREGFLTDEREVLWLKGQRYVARLVPSEVELSIPLDVRNPL